MYTYMGSSFIAAGNSLEVTLCIYMWEELGFNFSRHTGYSECGLPQSLQANVRKVP
jgi:hypothetical protein